LYVSFGTVECDASHSMIGIQFDAISKLVREAVGDIEKEIHGK